MRAALSQIDLSARVYHCILKLSRTIPDLARSEDIQTWQRRCALRDRPKLMMGQKSFCRQFILISIGNAVSLIMSSYY
jgi:hypothetical protein